LDRDDAGAKESWTWWAKHFERAKRWPVAQGKDPSEAYQAGLNLREWVMAGLPTDYLSGERQEADIQPEEVPDKADELSTPEKGFDFDGYLLGAIAELNEAGVDAMRSTESERSRAMVLEKEITQAANRKAVEEFVSKLDEWKQIFLNQLRIPKDQLNIEARVAS
jgi:hypothetical protein